MRGWILITENLKSIPEKTANQTLADYTESLTDWYISKTPIENRKRKGQYFTPKRVSSSLYTKETQVLIF